MASHLYFFTHSYPFGGESFVGNEIHALSKFYDKIFLFPSVTGKNLNDRLPSNVEICNLQPRSSNKLKVLLSNFGLIVNIFWLDFIRNTDKKNVIKRFRYNLSVCLNTIILGKMAEEIIEKDKADKRFVSFWMDQWALCLSVLKCKKKIDNFVFRVHQHDLYADGDPQRYIAFRYFNLKMAAAVFPDSKRGVAFLKNLDYYPEKIKLGHLGVSDRGTNPFGRNDFVMVSCSAIVTRKRVEKIIEVLKYIDEPVTWIHFGAYGDRPDSFEKLKKRSEELPANIKTLFKGDVSYNDLISFYRSTPVHLFITLSRAEGLPVSVIEAVSFGIPVLATDVMGLPDVVTESSGMIVSPEENDREIAGLIKHFMRSEKNSEEFRKKVKEFWKENFNSDVNYFNFNNYINSLGEA